MNLKMKAFLIGAVAYAFSLNAMALACSSTSNWGTMDTRAIDNFIVRLRKYIELEPSHPTHLVTVRSVGYRFVAEGPEEKKK